MTGELHGSREVHVITDLKVREVALVDRNVYAEPVQRINVTLVATKSEKAKVRELQQLARQIERRENWERNLEANVF